MILKQIKKFETNSDNLLEIQIYLEEISKYLRKGLNTLKIISENPLVYEYNSDSIRNKGYSERVSLDDTLLFRWISVNPGEYTTAYYTPEDLKFNTMEEALDFLDGRYRKSGVSARLTIAAFENAISAAERRAIIHNEKHTYVWISDLMGIIPSITGKIELVYEGEQEGPYEVALNLLNKAIRSQFVEYFPNPELLKKKKMVNKKGEEKALENPYKAITNWFDGGNHLNLLLDMKDAEKVIALYKVDGLFGLVKKYYPHANEKEAALLMEFVLHGLAAIS